MTIDDIDLLEKQKDLKYYKEYISKPETAEFDEFIQLINHKDRVRDWKRHTEIFRNYCGIITGVNSTFAIVPVSFYSFPKLFG